MTSIFAVLQRRRTFAARARRLPSSCSNSRSTCDDASQRFRCISRCSRDSTGDAADGSALDPDTPPPRPPARINRKDENPARPSPASVAFRSKAGLRVRPAVRIRRAVTCARPHRDRKDRTLVRGGGRMCPVRCEAPRASTPPRGVQPGLDPAAEGTREARPPRGYPCRALQRRAQRRARPPPTPRPSPAASRSTAASSGGRARVVGRVPPVPTMQAVLPVHRLASVSQHLRCSRNCCPPQTHHSAPPTSSNPPCHSPRVARPLYP